MSHLDFLMLSLFAAISFSPVSAARNYKGPEPGQPTATIALSIDTESAADASLRGTRMDIYDPANCTKSFKLTRIPLRDRATGNSEAVTIAAGAPIGITIYYTDIMFAENRSCSLSGAFTPKPGMSYQARFHVTPDIGKCDAVISQLASAESTNMPEFAIRPRVCPERASADLRSGIGYMLKWDVSVEIRR